MSVTQMRGRSVPPAVRDARRFLLGLRGPAYRYAYAMQSGSNPPPLDAQMAAAIMAALEAATAPGPAGVVALFVGHQERLRGPAIELWNLLIDLPGHPKGSTLARETIEAAGYTLPAVPRRNAPRRSAPKRAGQRAAAGRGAGTCPKGHALHWSDSGDRSRAWCNVCQTHYRATNPPDWLVDAGDDVAPEPLPGDYLVTGTRTGREAVSIAGGAFIAEFSSVDAALRFIAARSGDRNVWYISDRGDASLVTDLPALRRPRPFVAARPRGANRNPESWPCGYCGGPGGDMPGPGHAFACARYVKPKRRGPRSIGRRTSSNPCHRKTNPPAGRRSGVPENAVPIYDSYRFDQGTVGRGVHVNGRRYYHTHNSKSTMSTYGLPDGGLVLQPHRGRLWGYR